MKRLFILCVTTVALAAFVRSGVSAQGGPIYADGRNWSAFHYRLSERYPRYRPQGYGYYLDGQWWFNDRCEVWWVPRCARRFGFRTPGYWACMRYQDCNLPPRGAVRF